LATKGSKLVAILLIVVVVAAGAGYWLLSPKIPNESTSIVAQSSVLTPLERSSTSAEWTVLGSPITGPWATTYTGWVRMGLTSQAFGDGERIPSKYTCDGPDISPPIGWSGAANGTRSYVLIMEDLDAHPARFTHWMIFNIPASETGLQENIPATGSLSNGAKQGRNDFGKIGYGGPCPPSGTHHYVFRLYALDALLNLQPGATKQDVLDAMKGHILAETELTGLYSKG
jgi:Raf kinase inhibitor-like YbhB/YbcL family protein